MATEALQAFRNAMAFHEAAIRCSDPPSDESQKHYFMLLDPQIVCTAFAAELYLKCLLLHRGNAEKNEHRLYELFSKKLDHRERDAIAAHYERRRGAPKSRMLLELGRFSKAFVEWRYSHEQPLHLDVASLSAFAVSAYLAVRDLIPEWPVQEVPHERIVKEPTKFTAFVAKVGEEGPAAFTQAMEAALRAHGLSIAKPQPDVIKSEEHNLSLAVPTLNFHSETATLYVNVGTGADAQDGGPHEVIKYGRILAIPVVTREPRLDSENHA